MVLVNSVNEYDIIDLSDIAHEYSLFTISLSLAYKYLDDNPPFMVIHVYIFIYVLITYTETMVICINDIFKGTNRSRS